MSTAKEHYDEHLGPVYSWMAGDFAATKARAAALFERLELDPGAARLAADLGAGHGAQAAALAERGFDVIAIDFCAALLEELRANTREHAVTAVEGELLELERHVSEPLGAVVCLGDTLPHLASTDDVARLIGSAAKVLADGGKLVATFRDYVSREARGEARFIPVKADSSRILTCFLDYGPETVTVYDLLHERVDGEWRQRVSSYRKLRLDPQWLGAVCAREGLTVLELDASGGMITFVAEQRRRHGA